MNRASMGQSLVTLKNYTLDDKGMKVPKWLFLERLFQPFIHTDVGNQYKFFLASFWNFMAWWNHVMCYSNMMV